MLLICHYLLFKFFFFILFKYQFYLLLIFSLSYPPDIFSLSSPFPISQFEHFTFSLQTKRGKNIYVQSILKPLCKICFQLEQKVLFIKCCKIILPSESLLLLRNLHNATMLCVCAAVRGGKKNPNPLAHPNPPTNCPPKPTYLINGQMGASPIRPN